MKKLLIFVFIIFLTPLVFGQKANEAVHYLGKLKDVEVRFKLADGYLPASEINLKNLKTGKTGRFLPDTGTPDKSGSLTFHAVKPAGNKTEYFSISGLQEAFGNLVLKHFQAVFHLNGQVIRFPLNKAR